MLIYVSALISLLLTLIAGVPYIDFLKKRMYGQFIREDGPEAHSKKAGTPTMGGLIIVIPALIGSILSLLMAQQTTLSAFLVLFIFVMYTLIGFKDDFSKVINQHNKGLSARQKLLLQTLIALIPALYMTFIGERTVSLFQYSIDLGLLYPFFAIFVIVGASNSVNLTDGLDGLAAGTTAIAMAAATFVLLPHRIDLAIIAAAITGSCIAFLYFNRNPAQIFMGDTGSLALGGILGTLAIVGKFEFLLILLGGIFIIETLSVIIQVVSFKTTGKRVFKMSPIHHHFELLGWTEQQIVLYFCLIGLLFALVACFLKFKFF